MNAGEEREDETELEADDEALAGDDDDAPPIGPSLTGKQRRFLRALAHHLDPLVQLGKLGVTEGVLGALDIALENHELVKVRVGTECPVDTKEAARDVAERVGAALAQTLGRTFLVYRRHPREPRIELPS